MSSYFRLLILRVLSNKLAKDDSPQNSEYLLENFTLGLQLRRHFPICLNTYLDLLAATTLSAHSSLSMKNDPLSATRGRQGGGCLSYEPCSYRAILQSRAAYHAVTLPGLETSLEYHLQACLSSHRYPSGPWLPAKCGTSNGRSAAQTKNLAARIRAVTAQSEVCQHHVPHTRLRASVLVYTTLRTSTID